MTRSIQADNQKYVEGLAMIAEIDSRARNMRLVCATYAGRLKMYVAGVVSGMKTSRILKLSED